jgi:insulysin
VNEFIPQKLSVLKENIVEKSKKPNIIRETETVRIWHKKDDKFWVPKSSVYIKLKSPLVYATPKNYVMAL